MKINLSPIAGNKTTTISVDGLVLTIDGVVIDLSVIPEGGQAEADMDSPFTGIVTRDEVTVKYFYESIKAESNQSTDINDYIFDIVDGDIPCPIIWKPVEQEVVIDV